MDYFCFETSISLGSRKWFLFLFLFSLFFLFSLLFSSLSLSIPILILTFPETVVSCRCWEDPLSLLSLLEAKVSEMVSQDIRVLHTTWGANGTSCSRTPFLSSIDGAKKFLFFSLSFFLFSFFLSFLFVFFLFSFFHFSLLFFFFEISSLFFPLSPSLFLTPLPSLFFALLFFRIHTHTDGTFVIWMKGIARQTIQNYGQNFIEFVSLKTRQFSEFFGGSDDLLLDSFLEETGFFEFVFFFNFWRY